jgi:hypothetical protein
VDLPYQDEVIATMIVSQPCGRVQDLLVFKALHSVLLLPVDGHLTTDSRRVSRVYVVPTCTSNGGIYTRGKQNHIREQCIPLSQP